MTHYATLGVAELATPEEIKSAYRKLAKQHHPDLGGDVTKFQQISEAYETLADTDKRAHYNHQLRNPQPQFHQNFHGDNAVFNHINEQFSQMFGFNFMHPQTPRNRNIRIQLNVDFLETLEPFQKTVEYGLSNGNERLTLDIPAGISDNTVLQMAGRGDNAIVSVPRGTLEILIKINSNSKYTRIDEHILTEFTIDCFQAILGYDLEVEKPRGGKIILRIPPGTQSGTQLGVTDEGFRRNNGTLGKFIIRINVKIPSALTIDQINLVKQIQSLRPINT
jgi:curved DNA-binding protein